MLCAYMIDKCKILLGGVVPDSVRGGSCPGRVCPALQGNFVVGGLTVLSGAGSRYAHLTAQFSGYIFRYFIFPFGKAFHSCHIVLIS